MLRKGNEMKYPEDYINKIICGDCLWLVLCGLIIVGFSWWLLTRREREEEQAIATRNFIRHHERDYHE